MNKDLGTDVTAEFTDAGDLKDLHGALLSTQNVEQFLHEMAVLAAGLVGGGLSCGMTMQPNGRPVTVACSDQVAARVDEVQYELDDGPCLHAMRDGHMVRIEDTADKAGLAGVRGAGGLARDPVLPGPAAERGRQAGRRP